MKLSLLAASTITTGFAFVGASDATWQKKYYFDVKMASDPYAVPSSAGDESTGQGTVTVDSDGTVLLDIAWEVDEGISKNNPLIGIHIHAGDENTNGPIVFGFCGQDPLPPFGGKCQQGWSSDSAQTSTGYTGKICDMAPPAPCYKDGGSSAAEAVQDLKDGTPMYLNIHTKESFHANNDQALGLIRGQLFPMEDEASMTSVSREMEMVSDEMPSSSAAFASLARIAYGFVLAGAYFTI